MKDETKQEAQHVAEKTLELIDTLERYEESKKRHDYNNQARYFERIKNLKAELPLECHKLIDKLKYSQQTEIF